MTVADTSTKALVSVVPPLFKKILSYFPEQYFRYAFAYGSGVYDQGKTTGSNPMIDIIFSVDDSAGFHEQNILCNPSHYSALKKCGNNFVAAVQEKWPARVYFNTLIPIEDEGVMIKYGIVRQLDLIDDLLDWNYLYLSGRLHKPVNEILNPADKLKMALKQNLYSAVHSSLIILPEYFTERMFYTTIVALSYNGDFRMVVGENKNKVYNIVENQVEHFRKLYKPVLKAFEDYISFSSYENIDRMCNQDKSTEALMYHLFQLPKVPQQKLAKSWRTFNRHTRKDTEEIIREIAQDPDEAGILLSRCLAEIVFRSSYQQSLKGIFTAGFKKSLAYSNRKLKKMVQGS